MVHRDDRVPNAVELAVFGICLVAGIVATNFATSADEAARYIGYFITLVAAKYVSEITLVAAKYVSDGIGTISTALPRSRARRAFTYDGNGNRTKMVAGGTTTNYAYNADDELCATSSGTPSCSTPNYNYDGNGNLISSPVFSSLAYNAKDQTISRTPVGGSATSYSYADADQSERVTVGSRTLGWSMMGLAEESSDGGTFYTNDPTGSILGERVTNFGSNYYFLYDGLGSVVGVMDANGSVGKNYSYDAFGTTTESAHPP